MANNVPICYLYCIINATAMTDYFEDSIVHLTLLKVNKQFE